MPNDFQLDLFQLTPAELRARYGAGLTDFNTEDILMMRAVARKPEVLLASGTINSGTSNVGRLDTDAITTKVVIVPNWAVNVTKEVAADTVPFSSTPTVSSSFNVFGAVPFVLEGNFNNVEATLTGSDACAVLFYGYVPATS